MTPAYLRLDARPHLPPRARAMALMAVLGGLSGLVSSLPSPLPDIRLTDPDVLINTRSLPLHAGIAFSLMLGVVLRLWVNRDLNQMSARHGADAGGVACRRQHRQ